jgi:DNA-binding NarL/FixJ family response regulator
MGRVLIADDHPVVRAGLRQYLETEPGIRQIGEAGSGGETLEHLRAAQWNLLLLDINLPDRNGLDILRHVRATHPETRVLMLSGLPERQYAVNGLRSAPADFCPRIASRKNCSRLCARS